MILPRESWEGPQHSGPPAVPFVAQYIEQGGTGFLYLDRSVGQGFHHWGGAPPLCSEYPHGGGLMCHPSMVGEPPEWTGTWDVAVRTLRMVLGGH